MIYADNTSRKNWMIAEFLHEIRRSTLPVNLFISGNPTKKAVLYNSPITQNMYLEALEEVGG